MMRFTAFFAVIALASASGLYTLGDLAPLGLGDGSLSRQEIRSPDGIIRGTLTYIDGDGKIKSISYGGDNDIPKAASEAPTNTEEGQRAEEQPQQAEDSPKQSAEEMREESTDSSSDNNQNQSNGNSSENNNGNGQPELPQPVSYTPEVAAARAAHFAAREQAILLQQLAANQEQLEANQQQLLNQPAIVGYPPIFRDYYGAAKPLKSLNPYYYL